MNEDELKKAMEQNNKAAAKDDEIIDGVKKLSNVTEKKNVSDEEKESELLTHCIY